MRTVFDDEFAVYGKVIQGYDTAALLSVLRDTTECPSNSVVYVPSAPALEALPIARQLQNQVYGGMPIQLGYCNGENHTLNCLEYHRGCELNIPADDSILLLAPLQKVADGKLDTAQVEAFLAPAGVIVLLYETTLHYAPCSAGGGFRVVIVLPRGTNMEKPAIEGCNQEDGMLFACNKWLLAHPDSGEAKAGAYIGLVGCNITVEKGEIRQ